MPDLVANRVLIWVQIPNVVPDRVPGLIWYQVCHQISYRIDYEPRHGLKMRLVPDLFPYFAKDYVPELVPA